MTRFDAILMQYNLVVVTSGAPHGILIVPKVTARHNHFLLHIDRLKIDNKDEKLLYNIFQSETYDV